MGKKIKGTNSDDSHQNIKGDLPDGFLQFYATPKVDPELYCICRQPETGNMIACDNCEEWFHAECFNINLQEIVDIEHFPFMCH